MRVDCVSGKDAIRVFLALLVDDSNRAFVPTDSPIHIWSIDVSLSGDTFTRICFC